MSSDDAEPTCQDTLPPDPQAPSRRTRSRYAPTVTAPRSTRRATSAVRSVASRSRYAILPGPGFGHLLQVTVSPPGEPSAGPQDQVTTEVRDLHVPSAPVQNPAEVLRVDTVDRHHVWGQRHASHHSLRPASRLESARECAGRCRRNRWFRTVPTARRRGGTPDLYAVRATVGSDHDRGHRRSAGRVPAPARA
jgi:hypothetical protein